MKTMNALLKLQEKNLLKYVMFILLTTLLNHDYAIRHVIFYHEWICSRLPKVLKTEWICFRERTYSKETFIADNGKTNARMHVVYENGTENKSLLLQSLASSLYSTERHGRMVTEPVDEETLAESFGEEFTTGYIYVLKSLSTNPNISKLSNLYKIGFTRNDVESRIANVENDVTYLNAPVRVMLSAEVKNVNSQLLERTLHHVFQDKQVDFQDGNFKKATEWYLVPLDEIQAKINEVIVGLQK